MLADEPVASLDPEAAEEIMRLLRGLASNDGLPVVCVLHQPELARRYADRILGLRQGRTMFLMTQRPSCAQQIAALYEGHYAVNQDRPHRLRQRQAACAATRRASRALPFLGVLLFLVVLGQAAIVVQARPQDLITGAHGMADILRALLPARLLQDRRHCSSRRWRPSTSPFSAPPPRC